VAGEAGVVAGAEVEAAAAAWLVLRRRDPRLGDVEGGEGERGENVDVLLFVAMADTDTPFSAAAPAEASDCMVGALADADADVWGGNEARRLADGAAAAEAAEADACCC
jgi:hypothetical protein